MYRVEPDDKDRTYLLFEAIAKKVAKDMSSNVRIQAINAYLKSQGIIINDFWEHSSNFLTVYQYT
jgi:hypothetical protein